ncbi:MAG: aldo/keto reductase [Streptococcaceae bacterium]|jgi:diketogulonate reductase-like aldo/keto reductase|nr:aldo/keto reductase [Streptococcaceae bacterium]
MNLADTYKLINGAKIPVIGFGTWQTLNRDAENVIKIALENGYRHIDTAAIYGNEESVGRGIKKSKVSREEVFLTTKLWNDVLTYEDAKYAIHTSLEKLGVDYLDLYLIHWPNPRKSRPNWAKRNAEVWKAMEEAQKAGKIRAIGISNFHPHHIDALLQTAKILPQVNQIFVNPSDQQLEIIRYNQAHNILTAAYSPLGTGNLFKVAELKMLAEKYQKSIAQVVLRWSLQKGYLPLPKSVHEERIIENIQLFDFVLTDEDVTFIDDLKGVAGLAKNPDKLEF